MQLSEWASIATENTQHRGKYHCTSDLLSDWFGFDQTSKTVVCATEAKQLNPNKINRRSAVILLPIKLVFSASSSSFYHLLPKVGSTAATAATAATALFLFTVSARISGSWGREWTTSIRNLYPDCTRWPCRDRTFGKWSSGCRCGGTVSRIWSWQTWNIIKKTLRVYFLSFKYASFESFKTKTWTFNVFPESYRSFGKTSKPTTVYPQS